MAIVLVKRILKFVFLSENALRPVRVSFITKNPTIHVFRLNDEHPISGHDDMVNLCGSIRRWYGDVVDIHIDLGIKEYLLGERSLNLTYSPFENRPERH